MSSLPLSRPIAVRCRRFCPWTLLDRLVCWRQRSVGRRTLAGLDERLRRDIGLSAEEARREADKPFWQP